MSYSRAQNTPDTKHRSACPIASLLDIIGDKWTLLVIRDLFMGKGTYSEFEQSPENIPSNILAERLKRLERYQVIDKSKYQDRPVRYRYALTDKGKDLSSVLIEMMRWGNEHIPGTFDTSEIQKRMK